MALSLPQKVLAYAPSLSIRCHVLGFIVSRCCHYCKACAGSLHEFLFSSFDISVCLFVCSETGSPYVAMELVMQTRLKNGPKLMEICRLLHPKCRECHHSPLRFDYLSGLFVEEKTLVLLYLA